MKKTLGNKITELRKEKGMTQLDLANKMNVTDKAVSKWERDLSCPDIHTMNRLSEVLEVSLEELMQITCKPKKSIENLLDIVFKGVALAMGISTTVLLVLNQIEVKNALILLGIGLSSLAISQLDEMK